jgi:transglutaminase/protease-like cytokinesis protein 3
MKILACIVYVLLSNLAIAQKQLVNYNTIDWEVKDIDALSPAELAQKLTANYETDLEKTRAIFSWIAQHVSYNYAFNRPRSRNNKSTFAEIGSEMDTSTSLTPLTQLVAEDVIKKRKAFCYGYARLFKCLCDYAGIPCEVINGYAWRFQQNRQQFSHESYLERDKARQRVASC